MYFSDPGGLWKPRIEQAASDAYATMALLSREVDIKVLSARLGHSSPTITRALYQHVSPELDQDAADRVANLIFRRRVN